MKSLRFIKACVAESNDAKAMKAFNKLLKSFESDDSQINRLEKRIESNQDKISKIKDEISEESKLLNDLKTDLINASDDLRYSKEQLDDYKKSKIENINKEKSTSKTVTKITKTIN